MTGLNETLSDLIRINSVNAFYENGPGEAELARYIQNFFAKRGLETWTQPVFDASSNCEARSNVLVKLPGASTERRLVLEAHMDTVSIQGMTIPPFEPRIEQGKLFGRGACDTKAGLAAMMHAVADIHTSRQKPPCEIWLAAVVDEEYSFQGVLKLCKELDGGGSVAVVAEPSELRLVIASKGVLRWRMVSHGKAAHSSKTHLGINAIYHMARVVLALEQDQANLANTVHPLLGSASCNVGKIQGGVQVNFVPDQCAIEIDRRLLPGESIEKVWEYYESILDQIRSSTPGFDVRMEPPMLVDEAWTTDPKEESVLVAGKVLDAIGLNSTPCGVPFGSDASKFARAGIPSILFGPGSIDQAHSADEYIELAQVEQAYEFYRRFALAFS